MKSRFLIVIILLVAAVHLTLFLMTQRETTIVEGIADTSTGGESKEAPEGTPSMARSLPDVSATEESGNSPDTVATVEDAVDVIRNYDTLGSAPPIEKSLPEETLPPPSDSDATESGATMTVGLVDGNSKLPPELFEVAEEGAKAVASQDWEKAREIYLQMVSEAPENALGYANLGVAEHQLGNLLAAAGNLRKSLEINPSLAQNWQTLGLIRFERGELELAISALTRAIHEDPSDAQSRLYLAAVIRSYGWTEASITELERAVEAEPEFADAHYNLAVSYLELDPPRVELARRHYYSAIDLGADPSQEIEAVFRDFDKKE
ncbi:MAG: tetratricopeptide repeat protein [Verrucomicrobiota bacterium]